MKVFTVSEINSAIKGVLEPSFRGISVQGEVSNLKVQSSGHVYFSLKDQNAQISAVLFKGNAAKLLKIPKEGDQVVCVGEISLYAPRGSYQLVIRELKLLGVGELLLKLHELKEKLSQRGWFDSERKKPLPKYPQRIGVITSPTGAVIQDILHVLSRRFQNICLLLNPVKVQGEGAAFEIAKAIEDFNRYQLADVLIVGRGGGSIEDLWAFNEEIVAKAIFESKIPIISAVGHETDFTIADWVSDVRAPTPSAAAEIATAEKASLFNFLERTKTFCRQRIREKVLHMKQQIGSLKKHPFFSSPYGVLSSAIQRVDEFSQRLEMLSPKIKITQEKARLLRVQEHLQALHPNNILKKGYAIVFSEKMGSIILSARDLQISQKVALKFHDGKALSEVQEVNIESGNTFV